MSPAANAAAAPDIVVLAGGSGKRMKSGRPKALYPVFFRPMVHYALDAARAVPHSSLCLVVGPGEREIRDQCRDYPELLFAGQKKPGGSADAARAALDLLADDDATVLILYGDAVLLTPRSLHDLLAEHVRTRAACTVGVGAPGADPCAFCFRKRDLLDALKSGFEPGPEGESRLEEAAAALASRGAKVAGWRFPDPDEALCVDDRYSLWRAERVLQTGINKEWMLRGVTLQDPLTTVIDARSRIDPDAVIEGGCTVLNSVVAGGAKLECHCRVIDSEIGAHSEIRQGTVLENSRVGRDCRVGPYARLRGGANLEEDVWIGNFVEIKNASLGSGTRAAHLSFIADAHVGRNVNIGCGFITCNSRGGPTKQRTTIGDNVFIGSATQAIAPVTLGEGSFVATGTVLTDDIPADSFAISRGRQVTKPGYAKKYGKAKGPVPSR